MAGRLPKFTARQYFWYLTVAAGAFAFFGRGGGTGGAAGAEKSDSVMAKVERVPWEVVDVLLTPGRAVFSGAQSLASTAVARLAAVHADSKTAEEMGDEIRTKDNEIDYLSGQLQEANAQLQEIRTYKPRGLKETDLLPADITGMQAGPGAASVSLDKGSSEGVMKGMVVIAKSSVVGRVTAVGPKTSVAELLTDPGFAGVRARIVRKSEEGEQIIVGSCLVKGYGGGEMMCDTIDVHNTPIAPAVGDRVQVLDPTWPPKIQYMAIGDVSAVNRNEKQLLRYDLRITPRTAAGGVRGVLVVLHGD